MTNVEYFDGFHHGRTNTMIGTTGRITAKAKKVFTQGQCHALALAVHELTGYQLVGLYSYYEDPEYNTPAHVVVRMPNGSLLDIEGPGCESRWPNDAIEVTKEDVLEFQNRDYLEPNLEAARPFARTLCKRYGLAPFTPEVTK